MESAIKLASDAIDKAMDKLSEKTTDLWGKVYADAMKGIDHVFDRIEDLRKAFDDDINKMLDRVFQALDKTMTGFRDLIPALGVASRQAMKDLAKVLMPLNISLKGIITVGLHDGVLFVEGLRVAGPVEQNRRLEFLGIGCGGKPYTVRLRVSKPDGSVEELSPIEQVQNESKFDVPDTWINGRFADTKSVDIKVTLVSTQNSKPFFEQQTSIRLLPRMPITYTLEVNGSAEKVEVEALYEQREQKRFRAEYARLNPQAGQNDRMFAESIRLGELSTLIKTRLPIGSSETRVFDRVDGYRMKVVVGGIVHDLSNNNSYLDVEGYILKSTIDPVDSKRKRIVFRVEPSN